MMMFRSVAGFASLCVVIPTLGQTTRDLSFLDPLAEKERLPPAEVARLEADLIRNPLDLTSRARLLTNYFEYGVSQPRVEHIVWVVKNRPESKLAGSPVVRITPVSNSLSTRSDYERVRTLWLANVEEYPSKASVLVNAGLFFEREEPVRAAELFKRAWALEADNGFTRSALTNFYSRILSRCEQENNGCPDPVWLRQVKMDLNSLSAH